MTTNQDPCVARDERTVAVENAGQKMALNVVLYALLVDAIYRGLARGEAAWDLLGMAIAGGLIVVAYQARQKALPRGWGKTALLITVLGAVTGLVAVFVLMLVR